MNVLSIGTDERVFEEGSDVRERQRAYAQALGHLDLVVLSKHPHPAAADGALSLRAASGSPLVRLRRALRLARTLSKPDVVSAQDPFEVGLMAFFLARHFKAPLHIQVHTDFLSPEYARRSLVNRMRVWISGFTLKRAARIRVVSENIKHDIEAGYHPHAPITVLPIFIDLERFRSVPRHPEKGTVLWIGRFEAEKNPMYALDAFAALRASGADAHLTMLGSGRLGAALKERARYLDIAESVSFPGWSDPIPYLSKAELVLATSRYEGYGLSIVEALASGVPVLSTDVGVAREAGAIIASPEQFPEALVQWFKNGPRAASLHLHLHDDMQGAMQALADDTMATHANYGRTR